MRNGLGPVAALSLTAAVGALLAGCDDSYLDNGPSRAEQPISSATLAEMAKIDTTPSSPTLIRAYKKEADLEIWKMKSDGQYALLKTYPMCRWSGQLGPKKREGDMQVPEGFYPIAPGQMNPNSHYYLSFNVGYPNAYDRAYGRTGGSVMVHGVCSSAGCFSMTDEQVADIYAIARDSFRGGQREIQMQSYPFHMTAENMAKFRLDPNIDFWKELKEGSDRFEVAKTEPSVLVCGEHYVFGATASGEVSATAPCPALERDEAVDAEVAEKESKDNAKVAALIASGVKPIRLVYQDGGQNPSFAGYKDSSDPDALASGPQEVVPWAAGQGGSGGGEGRLGRRRQAARRGLAGAHPADGGRVRPVPGCARFSAGRSVGRRHPRRMGRERAEHQEMAASERSGADAADGYRLRARAADPLRRPAAAASRRSGRAGREGAPYGLAAWPAEAAGEAGRGRGA